MGVISLWLHTKAIAAMVDGLQIGCNPADGILLFKGCDDTFAVAVCVAAEPQHMVYFRLRKLMPSKLRVPMEHIFGSWLRVPMEHIFSGWLRVRLEHIFGGGLRVPMEHIFGGKLRVRLEHIVSGGLRVPMEHIFSGWLRVPMEHIFSGGLCVRLEHIFSGWLRVRLEHIPRRDFLRHQRKLNRGRFVRKRESSRFFQLCHFPFFIIT